ncbi:unnamed protein product [Oikopleura dioica]|uniref:Peptidase S1 domain-containing protein n=1 Tax=Oikopleura dioica TaxID=34765 RepID=E4XDF3_OIKDI|nr:unnamed protein product [Oikopleura dioica]
MRRICSKLVLQRQTLTEIPTYRIPPNLKCPSPNPGVGGLDRIVGGVTAIPHSWPWIASLWFGRFGCGGTIIGEKTVLTAAHCCDGYKRKLKKIRVKSGDHLFFEKDFGEEEHRVKRVFVHPGYSRRTMQNDICILAVEDIGLERRPTVDHACLPQPDWLPATGTRCWAAGFGESPRKGHSQRICKRLTWTFCRVNNAQTVLILDMLMKQACSVQEEKAAKTGKIPIVTGITSWGIGCGVAETPGVWTKVSSYLDWIDKVQNFVDRVL